MLKDFKDCAVLILSCDKNESLLRIFFDFFNKNWNDCPFDIYLGVESSNMVFDHVTVLKSNEKSFCSRIKHYLKLINKEYVLIILDDFILEEKVYNSEIARYYSIIHSNAFISNLTLAWIDGIESVYSDNIMAKAYNSNFLVNLQVGFWRTSVLQELIRPNENAWEAELLGSIRARKYKDRALFLHLSSDDDMPYKYNRGWLIVKGCWNGNEIRRLGLEKYASCFLDGKPIIYEQFGKTSKFNSLKIRFSVFIRKLLSNIGVYF